MDDTTFEPKDGKRRLYCNHCGCNTNHRCMYEEEEGRFGEEVVYRLWTCAGCDTGTLEEAWTGSGYIAENGEQMYDSTYHPGRASADLRVKRYKQLPKNLFLSIMSVSRAAMRGFTWSAPLASAHSLRVFVKIRRSPEEPSRNESMR